MGMHLGSATFFEAAPVGKGNSRRLYGTIQFIVRVHNPAQGKKLVVLGKRKGFDVFYMNGILRAHYSGTYMSSFI